MRAIANGSEERPGRTRSRRDRRVRVGREAHVVLRSRMPRGPDRMLHHSRSTLPTRPLCEEGHVPVELEFGKAHGRHSIPIFRRLPVQLMVRVRQTMAQFCVGACEFGLGAKAFAFVETPLPPAQCLGGGAGQPIGSPPEPQGFDSTPRHAARAAREFAREPTRRCAVTAPRAGIAIFDCGLELREFKTKQRALVVRKL